jgi:hypothetical protein
MAHHDPQLSPETHGQLAEIADRLRRLPCDNSIVAMDLHRIAREIEALVAGTMPPEAPSAQECRKELALTDNP